MRLSWRTFERDCHKLVKEIEQKKLVFNKIIAVPRGGLVPASILAYTMGCENVETLSETTTGTGALVIDEILDSGRTLDLIKIRMPDCYFGVVYTKQNHPLLDAFAVQVPSDVWVHMPWDDPHLIF